MNQNSRVIAELNGNVSLRSLPQGNAVLAFDVGQAFEVDDTGAEILRCLSEPLPIQEIVTRMATEYGVPESQIIEDIIEFLQECADFGVVHLSEGLK